MEEAHALGEFPLDVREEGEALEEGVEGVKLGGKRPFGPLPHLLAAVRVEEAEEGKRHKLHLVKDDVAAEAPFQALEAPPRGEEEALGMGKEGRELLFEWIIDHLDLVLSSFE